MAFSQKELEIIEAAKLNGLSRADAEEAITNYRLGIKPNEGNPSGLVFAGQKRNEARRGIGARVGGVIEHALHAVVQGEEVGDPASVLVKRENDLDV